MKDLVCIRKKKSKMDSIDWSWVDFLLKTKANSPETCSSQYEAI